MPTTLRLRSSLRSIEHLAAVAVRAAVTEASEAVAKAETACARLEAAEGELSELRDQLEALCTDSSPEERP